MNKICASLLIEELPGLVYFLRQNFCSPEISKLTLQQHRLMSLLLKKELHPGMLAQELSISSPAVSRMIHPLIEIGWIQKAIDPNDKRNFLLSLTKLGSKTLKDSKKKSQGLLALKIAKLTDLEQIKIIEAFEIIKKLKPNRRTLNENTERIDLTT